MLKNLVNSFKVGFGFGITSGIITTLGLIVGLYSGTHSKLAVIGAIIIIAVADAFSDSLGIHVSEEVARRLSSKQIWTSTVSTFLAKSFFALTFIIPILLFEFFTAILVSIIWGMFLLGLFSFYIAKDKNKNPLKTILEHLAIAFLVIIITYLLGRWVNATFS